MKRSEWNDEQLENILQHMPKIKDKRTPQEIYQNISFRNRKNKKGWVVPSIVSAAAAILILILTPSILNDNNSKTAQDSASEERSFMMESAKQEKNIAMDDSSMDSENVEEEQDVSILENQPQTDYVVRSINDDEVILTYGVMVDLVSFPTVVSVIVHSDGSDIVEQFEKHIPVLNEKIQGTDMGIDPFPNQYFEDFTGENSEIVRIDVPKGLTTESFTAAQLATFETALDSFKYLDGGLTQIHFFRDNKQGLMIGETGIIEDARKIVKETKKAYLYFKKKNSPYKILTPTRESFDTFTDAINAMDDPYYSLQPTVTDSTIIKEIKENKNNVEVIFKNDAGLANNDQYKVMIDAIMLTAKDFGFETVIFRGDITHIGDVPFGEPVKVPIAPNPININ